MLYRNSRKALCKGKNAFFSLPISLSASLKVNTMVRLPAVILEHGVTLWMNSGIQGGEVGRKNLGSTLSDFGCIPPEEISS